MKFKCPQCSYASDDLQAVVDHGKKHDGFRELDLLPQILKK